MLLVSLGVIVAALVGVIIGILVARPDDDDTASASRGVTVPTTTLPATTPVTPTTTTSPKAKTSTTTTTKQSSDTPGPSTSTEALTPPPGEEQIYDFFGLRIPLGPEWKILPDLSNGYRTVVIDTTRCDGATYEGNCDGFVVVNFRGDGWQYLPYDNVQWKVESDNGKPCYWNGVDDDTYYGPVEKVNVEQMGAVKMRHAQQEQCGTSGGSHDDMHSWRSDSLGIVVYDRDRDNNGPLRGLEEILARATVEP